MCMPYNKGVPALGGSVRTSAWQPEDWGFVSGRVVLKTLKVVFVASRQALSTTGSAKG